MKRPNFRINIGKFQFGIHANATPKKNPLPRRYTPVDHEYFQYFYVWLWFYWCKPRKCHMCGKYVCGHGGIKTLDKDGYGIKIVLCCQCAIKENINKKHTYESCKRCGKCDI